MKTIVVPHEITEMCIIPVKRSKVSHLLLVALSDGIFIQLLIFLFSLISLILFFYFEALFIELFGLNKTFPIQCDSSPEIST